MPDLSLSDLWLQAVIRPPSPRINRRLVPLQGELVPDDVDPKGVMIAETVKEAEAGEGRWFIVDDRDDRDSWKINHVLFLAQRWKRYRALMGDSVTERVGKRIDPRQVEGLFIWRKKPEKPKESTP